MYLVGQGHEHVGPGTSMVQRINWTGAQERQLMAATRGPGRSGLGCGCRGMAGCGCAGLGLFDTGLDFSGWGGVEWALVAIGGYVLLSTVFTTQRGAERVRKSFKKYARRKAVAA